MSIFEGVLSQYIDTNGKTRVINYGGLSLSTSPMPPIDVESVKIKDVHITSVESAIKFVNSRNLKIAEQDGDEGLQLIQGLWVRSTSTPPQIAYGYIPIEIPDSGTNAIDGVPFSDKTTNDPLFVGTESHLDEMRENSRIAGYLKHYSLVKWAQDPDEFDTDSYTIRPNHVYDLSELSSRIDRKNKVIHRKGKIIVHDEETASRLVSYVKVSAMNDSTLADTYKEKVVFDGPDLFTSITEFRRTKNQLVFMNRNDVLQWKMERSREFANSNVYADPRPENKEPYYYRNLSIKNGDLVIIQNTKDGDLQSALAVSNSWEFRTVNPGYIPASTEYVQTTGISFEVYTDEGLTHESDISPTVKNPRRKVFGYEDGRYGAILFL